MFLSAWAQWLKLPARGRPRKRERRRPRPNLERLEDRITPSAGAEAQPFIISMPLSHNAVPQGGVLTYNGAFAPLGIQQAYGIDQVIAKGNAGAGETIAVIDAYDDPDLSSSGTPAFATSDLHYFDLQFGLPDPVFTKVAQNGSSNYPRTDPSAGPDNWEAEEALDVEWAHALAPAANILLVECNSLNNSDLLAGAKWAAISAASGGGGATVVSMSFGNPGGISGETADDANFSPTSFPGVTFVAAVGDSGSVNNQGDYPADSPDVVAVGGTQLTVTAGGAYSSESVWNDGFGEATSGGTSRFESQPAYQKLAEPTLTKRSTPDVAFLADPNTGVAVYDSYNQEAGQGNSANFVKFGGTSLAAPCWAALIAIADQIRASQAVPEPPLTGATQTLPILYDLYSSPSYLQDFHDITSGSNGSFSAAVGYDEVSGIGSPIANNLVPALADVNQLVYTAPSGTNSFLLQVSGSNLDLLDNGTLVAANPLSETSSVVIAGNSDNSLTVNGAGLPASISVNFDGGLGSRNHTLTFENGSFTNETYGFTGTGSGTISLDGVAVTFAHVTSSINTTPAGSVTFDLPTGAQAYFQASANQTNTMTGTGLVTSAFGDPTSALTVSTAGGDSFVRQTALDANFKPAAETITGQAGDIFQLLSSAAFASTTSVSFAGTKLDLDGFSPVIDALSGNGAITNTSTIAATLTVGANNGSGTFSGLLTDGAGLVALTKTGAGTETFTGASNYSGVTTITGGTLEVDGSIGSNVTIFTGGTLTGSGATGTVSVQSGGGDLFSGTAVSDLSSGSLTLLAGSSFNVAIDSSSNYSSDTVTSGTVTLSGVNLVLSGPFVPAYGQIYTIVNNNGTQPVSGTFNGLPEGAALPNFLGSGLTAYISYVGGDGNDVVLYVGQGSTTQTQVSASSGAMTYGQSVTFTATVNSGGGTPSGNVEFFDVTTGADLGSGNLQSAGAGAATWTYTARPNQIQVTGGDVIQANFTAPAGYYDSVGTLAGGLAVTPASLAVSGLTANNKVYDQTTSATVNSAGAALVGLVSGDLVTLNATGATGTFASKDVANNIAVTVAGLAIGGPQAGDYTLLQPKTTANITPAPVTVTGITVDSKVYDATTSATLNASGAALVGIAGGDLVTLNASGATGAFATKNVGSNIPVTVTGLALGGPQAGDYLLVPSQALPTGTITPAPLSIAATANTKLYDGNTSAAALPTVLGILGTDAVTGLAEAYTDPKLGTGKTLIVTAYTVNDGDGGNNYEVFTYFNTAGVINPGPFSKFAVSVLGGNTVVAGNSFLLTAQAVDQYGNPVSSYNGPASITATTNPADPQGSFPIIAQPNSSGLAFFVGTLQTAGSYTLSAGGASTSVIVTPASTSYFLVTAPTSATTGVPFNVTVQALDRFGNPTPGYLGAVEITSTDPAAFVLVPSYTFMPADQGTHTFSVILNTSTLGSAATSIIVRDTSASLVSGFSAPVTVQGLVVVPGGFQKTATGFTVTFSKPFIPADVTMYGLNTTTVQDVALVGANNGNIPGSLLLDPANPDTVVFKASSAYLLELNASNDDAASAALPDDTYTVTLVSGTGSNGFVDAFNSHLDGLSNGGTANYTITYTTTYQDDAHGNANSAEVLGIPDFARGPDPSTIITVPNNKPAPGIPITLYNASGLTDATFTLTYNPQILAPTAGGTGDAPAGSTFAMGAITSIDSTHASVVFTYHNATALAGAVVLGDILATVPSSAASIYKTKALLALSNVSVNGGATVLAADGIQVDAYLGDVHVTALPAIDASDALDAEEVASGAATGFTAYGLLDPAIMGGIIPGHTVSVDAADVTALFTEAAHGSVPTLPSIPAAVGTISVGGADPTLSLAGTGRSANGIVSVSVMLDNPDPAGSTGMTEAHLAITYDPVVLSVAPADITLGSIPGLGTGWQITSEVDAASGQIGIELISLTGTPITSAQAGSLVNIDFHVVRGAADTTAVHVVSQVTANGQPIVTEVDDDQGPLEVSLGVDKLMVRIRIWKSRFEA